MNSSLRFIVIATLVFIPYTILWFFWHNNIFHSLYYTLDTVAKPGIQNVWLMNFANALLVYGMVFFLIRAIKQETKAFNVIRLGVYYNISAVGFLCFMNFGLMKNWQLNILIHDLFFAILSGVYAGSMIYLLNKKVK